MFNICQTFLTTSCPIQINTLFYFAISYNYKIRMGNSAIDA